MIGDGLPSPRHHSSHRHADHRFEWTREQFATWTSAVSARYGYGVELRGVGEDDPEVGTPTQLALFTKGETA